MIVLENINKNGNIIDADYYYENEVHDKGHIKFDLVKEEYIEIVYNDSDKKYNHFYGSWKIKTAIKRMKEHNKYPSTYHYMWY